jgi:hypothetical protein
MDHLDDLAVAKGGEVGHWVAGLAAQGGWAQEHHDLVAGVDEFDELAEGAALAGLSHDVEGLLAVVAGACGGRVAAVPPDLGIEQVGDDVEISIEDGLIAAPSQFDVALSHDPIVPPTT